jgi:hypothetical protein
MFCAKIEGCLQNLHNLPDPIAAFRKTNGVRSDALS